MQHQEIVSSSDRGDHAAYKKTTTIHPGSLGQPKQKVKLLFWATEHHPYRLEGRSLIQDIRITTVSEMFWPNQDIRLHL